MYRFYYIFVIYLLFNIFVNIKNMIFYKGWREIFFQLSRVT